MTKLRTLSKASGTRLKTRRILQMNKWNPEGHNPQTSRNSSHSKHNSGTNAEASWRVRTLPFILHAAAAPPIMTAATGAPNPPQWQPCFHIIQYTMVTFHIHLPGLKGIIRNMRALISLRCASILCGTLGECHKGCVGDASRTDLQARAAASGREIIYEIIHHSFCNAEVVRRWGWGGGMEERETSTRRAGGSGESERQFRSTCVTESDRRFSCGKIALIHFPHTKSSCLQYSCHLAQ